MAKPTLINTTSPLPYPHHLPLSIPPALFPIPTTCPYPYHLPIFVPPTPTTYLLPYHLPLSYLFAHRVCGHRASGRADGRADAAHLDASPPAPPLHNLIPVGISIRIPTVQYPYSYPYL